jgi:large subunit ribosomal protein L3
MLREIFGKKIGMTQIFNGDGNLKGVTLIEIEPVLLLDVVKYAKTIKVRIGCFKIGNNKISKVKKPVLGYFNKLGVSPYRLIREVEAEKDSDLSFIEEKESKNREVGIEIFKDGEIVDVRAKTKGKGFAGGMRRHGWHGGPRSHGSTTHRRIGSAGASTYPARVIKGHRMPGHMGDVYRTTKNLKIVKIDKDKKLLFIEGSIPGSKGCIVKIRKAG